MDTPTDVWMDTWRNIFAKSVILRRFDFKFHFTGSRILSPAEADRNTDLDIAMWVHEDNLTETMGLLESEWCFKLESPEHYRGLAEGGFVSLRAGLTNLVLTTNAGFYRKHQLATELGARLGLIGKSARVKWFRKVLYGESMVPARASDVEDLESIPEPPEDNGRRTGRFVASAAGFYTIQSFRGVELFVEGPKTDFSAVEARIRANIGKGPRIPLDWRDEQRQKHKGRPK